MTLRVLVLPGFDPYIRVVWVVCTQMEPSYRHRGVRSHFMAGLLPMIIRNPRVYFYHIILNFAGYRFQSLRGYHRSQSER